MVPEVVVQDELQQGVLQKYCEVPDLFEQFYAITARRHFRSAALKAVLAGA
jgi:LysR family transcriptional activator of nhaA